MRLSCLPVSFFSEIISGRMSIADWARIGTEIGLDAIDLSILFISDKSPSGLAATRHHVEDTGMGIAMITSYPDFTHPDPKQRKFELEKEIEVVEIAALLGAKMVRVTAGQAHPATARSNGINWAVENLIALIELTKNSGITLVYENHAKPGAWDFTDFSQPPDIFLEIFDQTNDAGLGVNFDTGNAAAFTPDPVDFLKKIIHRVVSVHASDTSTHGELNHVALGKGVTPFIDIYSTLNTHGWNGWICMEEASYTGRQGIELAAQFTRDAWQSADKLKNPFTR